MKSFELSQFAEDFMVEEKSKGIIYIALGEKFVKEACQSAATVKTHMPHIPITLFTDKTCNSPYIDHVVPINPKYQNEFLNRMQFIYYSPYEYTLALDTDTYICTDFSDIFALLDRFDLALAHAPFRISFADYSSQTLYNIPEIPESFPEPNVGVILFKKHPRVEQFFKEWIRVYSSQMQQPIKPVIDQPAAREALYKSDLHFAILPPEYNCRFLFPVFVSGTVKILHGRSPDLPAIARAINAATTPRVFLYWDFYKHSQLPSLFQTQGEHIPTLGVYWDWTMRDIMEDSHPLLEELRRLRCENERLQQEILQLKQSFLKKVTHVLKNLLHRIL